MTNPVAEARQILAEKDRSKKESGSRQWTLRELMSTELEPTRYVVDGILPEGLTGVIAPGKIGKSFLLSGIALSVCRGSLALEAIGTHKAEVLYIDLEQNAPKAKSRWRQVLCGDDPPAGLHIQFDWKPLDKGGLEDIDRAIEKNPAVRLVVIDVFTKVKPTVAKGMNAYDQEYQILGNLKALADRRRIAIAFVHHTNRTKSDDPLDSVSGTNAMVGVPDAIWMLSRSRGKKVGKLYVTGRTAYEATFELVWSPSSGSWRISSEEAT